MKLIEERKEIVAMGNRLVAEGLVSNGQGNISIFDRKSGLVAITPSAVPYEDRAAEDICVIDLDYNLVEGNWKPTSETPLHLIYFKKRTDINSVIHTHAPKATVFGVIGPDPMPMILTEAATGLGGSVPVAPYVRPGTEELAQVTCEAVGEGFAAIMAHHGLITMGATLEHAFAATAAAEITADTLIMARALGANPKPLDENEIKTLRKMFMGYKPHKS